MTAIKGDAVIFSVWDDTGSAYRPVACLTSNSLTQTTTVNESQTKCNPGETTKSKGSRSYSVGLEGEYIDTTSVGGETALASHDFLMDLSEAPENIFWRMSTGLADTPFYYGESIMSDLALTAPAGEDATFTGTLEGTGGIVRIDPKA